jgi:hypothetical protein
VVYTHHSLTTLLCGLHHIAVYILRPLNHIVVQNVVQRLHKMESEKQKKLPGIEPVSLPLKGS